MEHLQTRNFKLGLAGTVRMETPVIYFYSALPRRVSVNVSFAKGLITEWYPHASRVAPRGDLSNANRSGNGMPDGSVSWDSLQIDPLAKATFPSDKPNNPYYAARETAAAPLRISSRPTNEQERFLFYRGVSTVVLPLSAKIAADGAVQAENTGGGVIPNAILFERRGEEVGYLVLGPVRDRGSFHGPGLTGSLDSLRRDLETVLVSQGLYADEAAAMVKTWKDSWFEEGARLFYIVPRETVDTILPLSIRPAPRLTVRVFVGRLELVTPATRRAVEYAFAVKDRTMLKKYGRFLEPILRVMMQDASDAAARTRLEEDLHLLYDGRLWQSTDAAEAHGPGLR